MYRYMFVILALALPLSATSKQALVSGTDRAKTIIQDFRSISHVSEINANDRAGYAQHVDDLMSLAQRSVRWQIVDVDVSAFGSWTRDRLNMSETVQLQLFHNVECELRMPASNKRRGDLVSFSATLERDGKPLTLERDGKLLEVPPIEGFIWRTGALEIPTLFCDGRYFSIEPLVNYPGLIPIGQIPHLVVEFDPEIEYTREELHSGDIQVEFDFPQVDPKSIQGDVPRSHVLGSQ